MDERINIGDKIDLEKIETRLAVNPDTMPKVYVSQVLDEGTDDSMYIAMPFQEGKLIPISVGQELKLTFFAKSGLLQCKAIVMNRLKKDSLFLMEIQLTTDLKKIQRREYFRFSCRIPLEYRILDDEEREQLELDHKYETSAEQLEWKNGIILDLSGGGIRFVSANKEKKDAVFQIRFEIQSGEEKEMMRIFAKLLRSESNPNNNTLYDNRVEYWLVEDNKREKIIRFIFEEQRRNRSKQLGNDN